MRKIEHNEADLMTLDSGLGYFAGRQHNMMPIMAEKYGSGKRLFEMKKYKYISVCQLPVFPISP